MKTINYFLLLSIYLPTFAYCKANLTAWEAHRRTKRFLTSQYGGNVRIVVGISFPIRLMDRVPYRQVRVLYNFQSSYDVPTTAASWKPLWLERKLEDVQNDYEKLNEKDQLRTVVYTMLEVELNRNGRNGRECLKRAICENGHHATNDGLLAEIVHEVLRPSKYNSDKEYIDAYRAGEANADCLTAFPNCPHGDSFLDNIIFLKHS